MAAPAFGSAGTRLTGGTSSTANVAVPSGVASGDIIVAYLFGQDATRTCTGPDGSWSHAPNSPVTMATGGAHRLHVMWRRATGADSGTYTFTFSTSDWREGVAVRYTGCLASGDPWDTSNTATLTSTGGVFTTPAVSLTTTGVDELLVFSATSWAGCSYTPPTGFAERFDAQGAGGSDAGVTVADLAQSAAGGSGTVQATMSAIGTACAFLGALKPAEAVAPRGDVVTRLGVGVGGMNTGSALTFDGPNLTASSITTYMIVGVVISVSSNSSSTTCSVTCGGTTMTQLSLTLVGTSTNRNAVGIYYLANPGTGTKSIVVTPAGASTKAGCIANAVAFSQVGAVGAAQTGTATTHAVNSIVNGYAIRVLGNANVLTSPNETQEYLNGQAVGGSGDYGLIQSAAGASSVSFTSSGTAGQANSVAVSLSPRYLKPIRINQAVSRAATY
jgi:hypothetical protein